MTYGKSSEMDEMEALRAENNTLKAGRAESMKVAARLSRTQAELKACKLDLWSKEEQLLDARAAFETRGIQHLDAAMTKIKQLRVDRAAAVKRAEAAEAQVQGLEEDVAFAQSEKSRLAQELALAEERATEATVDLHKWQRNMTTEESCRRMNSETRIGNDLLNQAGTRRVDDTLDHRDNQAESGTMTSEFAVSNVTQMGWAEDQSRQPSQDRTETLAHELAAARVLVLEQEANMKDAELASAKQALTKALEAAATRDAEWGAVVDGLEELIVSERAKAVSALRAERDRTNAAISKALARNEVNGQRHSTTKENEDEPPAPGWVRRKVEKRSHRHRGVNAAPLNESNDVMEPVEINESVIAATEAPGKAEPLSLQDIPQNEKVITVETCEGVPSQDTSNAGTSRMEEIQDEKTHLGEVPVAQKEAHIEHEEDNNADLEDRKEVKTDMAETHVTEAVETCPEPAEVIEATTTPVDASSGQSANASEEENAVKKQEVVRESRKSLELNEREMVEERDPAADPVAAVPVVQSMSDPIPPTSDESGGSDNNHADIGPSTEVASGTESDEVPSTGVEQNNVDTYDSALEVSVLNVTVGMTTTIQTAETKRQQDSASEGSDEADIVGGGAAAAVAPLEEENSSDKGSETLSEKELEKPEAEVNEEDAAEVDIAASALESEEGDIVEAEAEDSVSPLSPLSPGSTSGGMALDSQPTTAETAQAADVAVNPSSISTPSQSNGAADSTGVGSASRGGTPSGSSYSDEDSCDTLAMEAELQRLKSASEQARNKLMTSP